MSKRLSTLLACLAAAGSLGFAGQALAAQTSGHTDSCFLSRDWEGWKSPSPNVIYLRISISQIYRLDLSAGSNQLQEGDVHLVNKVRGSDWICSPLDMDLSLADDHGAFREPLFVKSITKLTPDQIAAIPRKFLP